jgi:hypothetical protein
MERQSGNNNKRDGRSKMELRRCTEQGRCENRVRGCGNRIEGKNGGSERTQRGRGNARKWHVMIVDKCCGESGEEAVRLGGDEGMRWTGAEAVR